MQHGAEAWVSTSQTPWQTLGPSQGQLTVLWQCPAGMYDRISRLSLACIVPRIQAGSYASKPTFFDAFCGVKVAKLLSCSC